MSQKASPNARKRAAEKRSKRQRSERQRSERRGRWSERAASCVLRAKGYHILGQRARTPLGELDLIARRAGVIAFVEVKYRADLDAAKQAVTDQNWQRIARAAEIWMARRPDLRGYDWRYDLMALAPGHLPCHLRDYWRP